MTVDEQVDGVMVEIDAHVRTLLDDSFSRSIAAGRSYDDAIELVKEQVAEVAAWRRDTLAKLRELIASVNL
jgi:hypothetical protein